MLEPGSTRGRYPIVRDPPKERVEGVMCRVKGEEMLEPGKGRLKYTTTKQMG